MQPCNHINMNLLTLSWKNIINKPLSMLLSLVLFALGVGLISLLFLLDKQMGEKFEKNQAEIDLVIGAKGSPLQMILCSMYHVDAPTGNVSIKEIRPFLNPKHPLIKTAIPLSLGDSHKGYRIVGTTHQILDLYQAEIGEGLIWKNNFEVTIGAGVAEDLGLKIGHEFSSSHGFVLDDNLKHDDAPPFKVKGILKPTGSVIDQLILCTSHSIWEVHDHDHGAANSEQDAANSEQDSVDSHAGHHHHEAPKALIDEVDKDITSLLIQFKNKKGYQALNMARSINENTDLQAASPAIEINRLYDNIGVGTDALTMLAYIIIFVSGLSIFISLFSSLKERKYELALMRVMGSSRSKLFLLIVLEGLILAVLGYILGIALSHIGMEVLAKFMKESYRYTFSGMQFLPKELWLLAGALLIGFVAAIIPAIQASNTDISETLAKA